MKHKSLKLQILFALVLIPALGWLWTLRGQAAELVELESYSIYLPIMRNSTLTWDEVGFNSAAGSGISGKIDSSLFPSLVVAPDSTLYIAWQQTTDLSSTNGIYVLHWNGLSWEEVGEDSASGYGINDPGGNPNLPSIAIAPDGTPYVAWEAAIGWESDVYIKRWDGNNWVEVGEGSASPGGISHTGSAYKPLIDIAPDGTPYIVWINYTPEGEKIYMRRWDGSEWVEIGSGSASGGGISNYVNSAMKISFDIAPDGTPYIAWQDIHQLEITYSEIYILKWDGSEWVEVGSSSASGGGISNSNELWAWHPSLAIAPDGSPYVTWVIFSGYNSPQSGIFIRHWNGTIWEEIGEGGIGCDPSCPDNPSLFIAMDGTPYLAWNGHINLLNNEPLQIYLRRWDGSNWLEAGASLASNGGISNTPYSSTYPSLAITQDGIPYVAWSTDLWGHIVGFGKSKIYIRNFNGSDWVEVGEGSASGDGISGRFSSNAFDPSIAFSSDGIPYVAWENEDAGEIYVRAWDSDIWDSVGTNSAKGGGISNTPDVSSRPAIFVVGSKPYIAWEEEIPNNSEIYLKQLGGIDWTEVGFGSASDGGISNTPGQSQFPVLAATQEGILYLAWQDDSSGNEEIYIRQWDGSTWTEIGAGSATGGGVSNTSNASTHPVLALSAAGVPYLAWEEEQAGNADIYIRQWDGSNWVEVGTGSASGGGISNNAGASLTPALAVTPDGVIYLAWEDTSSGDSQIYVRQWDGSSWSGVGVGSASGGGISLIGASTAPSIGVSFTGVPMVSWSAAPAGLCCEIYVLQWNGTQWVEVGETSASNGGISNTSGISAHPVLAFAPNGNAFVVWEDDTSGNFEIYIRRYPLSPFPYE